MVFGLLLLAACGSGTCVDVTADCDALYEPTFDNLHERTLVPSCALEGGCHAADSAAGGLDLSEIETAYDALGGTLDADELGCNTLIARIDSDQDDFVMPPGSALPLAERCAIRQWVDAGAQR